MKLKIFTVLKSGKTFKPAHVYAIKSMCEKFIKNHQFDFYCLSDLTNLMCKTIKLKHDWPTWWSKIELFKQTGPALYFDLDIIINKNIDSIINSIKEVEFCGLKDQWHPRDINSSIMYWSRDMTRLYNDFSKRPDEYIKNYKGDQDYISAKINNRIYMQDLNPSEIVSYKANILSGKNFDPKHHKIVYFHGPPRPWEQHTIPYNYVIKNYPGTKFDTELYNSFSRINDETFPATLIEGTNKLEPICNLVEDKSCCLQAGCSFGVFAHYLSSVFETVYTCEPSPTIFKYAAQNIGHIKNINLINCGLSNKDGNCAENFDHKNCGATSLDDSKPGSVQLKTIDSILSNEKSCGLLYLDIEGMEDKAIQGAKQTIENHRPIIVLENKGLIPAWGGNFDGSQRFRDHITTKYRYKFYSRLMRDDIFMPI